MQKFGYINEFEIVDDHRAGKIVINLIGRVNKVFMSVGGCGCDVFNSTVRCGALWCWEMNKQTNKEEKIKYIPTLVKVNWCLCEMMKHITETKKKTWLHNEDIK